ncbi:MAG: hypothetical protein JWM87_722 [Candidatus Eremiobacteraeota bacterium]|nr:hypothetical protein [Candidatus Eremiobacteraeota bacterium]
MLTDDERAVVHSLGKCASDFFALPVMHPSDVREFEAGTHSLQNIVMARAAQRAHPADFPVKSLPLKPRSTP